MLSNVCALFILFSAASAANFTASQQGESCATHCAKAGLSCVPHVETHNSSAIFQSAGLDCKPRADVAAYWAPDQPSASVDPADKNYGLCLGYVGVPDVDSCDASYPTVRRVCQCGSPLPPPTPAPASPAPFFGTGLSNGKITPVETELFAHTVDEGHYGVMSHFWMTAQAGVADGTIVRYYIDGETNASIAFKPPLACGTALDGESDATAPWGTQWFGKGAKDGAWFHNFRIPFQSIRITLQHEAGTKDGVYFIVRGARDLPVEIGGVSVPVKEKKARMKLQVLDRHAAQPLEYVTTAEAPTGTAGLLFMSTLAVESGNLNFLEGCYHAYTPHSAPYPGVVVSTGTEDYYDSAWYFNAGGFQLPVSGFTHKSTTPTGGVSWSAYRFHEMDPMPFSDGFRFVWRNGDADDPVTGLKCFTETGGRTVGNPTVSNVTSYAWMYTWNP